MIQSDGNCFCRDNVIRKCLGHNSSTKTECNEFLVVVLHFFKYAFFSITYKILNLRNKIFASHTSGLKKMSSKVT